MIQIVIVEALVFVALGIGAIGGSRLAFWLLERYVVFNGHHHEPGETGSSNEQE